MDSYLKKDRRGEVSEKEPAEPVGDGYDSSSRSSRDIPSTVQLVMAADEDFAMSMAVTLFSILHHLSSGQKIQITALDAGVTDESKDRIADVAQREHEKAHLEWICPDVSLIEDVEIEMDPRFSPAIFYRLLIPEIFPESCHRVLYIDSDIVMERSILPLWRKALGENAVRAVPERIVSCPKAGVAEWQRLGLDAGALFFNSGLMLINVDAWREHDLHKQAIEYLLNPENDFCYASDQEALNAVLAEQWEALDYRWNAIHQVYDPELRSRHEVMLGTTLSSIRHEPFGIHYTSDNKPWLSGCTHPARDRFYHYLRQSGWFSPVEYLRWRATLALRDGLHTVKEVTRPFRHRIGLRR